MLKIWQLLQETSFRKRDWALVCVSNQCWYFLFIALFHMILILASLVIQLACKIYCYTKYQVLFSLWRIKLAVKTVNCYLKLLLYHWLYENFSFVSHIINSRYKFLKIFWINRKKSIKKLPPTAVGTFLISVFDLKQLCKTMPTEKC